MRSCIARMRSRTVKAAVAAWQQWAARQQDLGSRLQQAAAERHVKEKRAVLRQWVAWAAAAGKQRQQLRQAVGAIRSSALARYGGRFNSTVPSVTVARPVLSMIGSSMKQRQ